MESLRVSKRWDLLDSLGEEIIGEDDGQQRSGGRRGNRGQGTSGNGSKSAPNLHESVGDNLAFVP